jgi:hypothetical protein
VPTLQISKKETLIWGIESFSRKALKLRRSNKVLKDENLTIYLSVVDRLSLKTTSIGQSIHT